jgi:meiosis induction protein kinase IME2/SME1
MALGHEYPPRASSYGQPLSTTCLEDKFELIKEIGDGSFGSVALARVRTAGAHIARRGTLVSINAPRNRAAMLTSH